MADAPGTLAEALAQLQTMLPRVAKEHTANVTSQRTGKTHKYDYADLFDVSAVLLPVLGALGLSFVTRPTLADSGHLVLAYALWHSCGDKIEGEYPLPATGSPQEIGSAITYARRYALCAVTGLAPGGDDDDGQAAEDHAQARPSAQTPAQQKAAATRKRSGQVDKTPMTNQERGGAGLMDRQQAAQAERDAALPPARPAHRGGKAVYDQWAVPEPAAAPLAIEPLEPETDPAVFANSLQVRAIHTMYSRMSINGEDLRHADAAWRLGVDQLPPDPAKPGGGPSFNGLSFGQAGDLIKALQDEQGSGA